MATTDTISDGSVAKRILLSPPHVGERERAFLNAAFDSNWIAPVGPDVLAFEADVGDWVGRKHVASLVSGSSALHLSMVLLGVESGDEVVVPTLTFAASANVVTYVGATPVFVDSEPLTMNLDPNLLADELRARAAKNRLPKAVMAVDLFGQAARYEDLEKICAEFEIPLVEDAAQSLGGSRRNKPCGSFGSLAAFSFNGNKVATTSGGGALASDDAELIDRARYLASQARQPVSHYEHIDIGYNYRLSNLLAAVGRGQLSWLGERLARRRAIRDRYVEAFVENPNVEVTPIDPMNDSNCWLTTISLNAELGNLPEEVRLALERDNIESRRMWKPMHLQPIYNQYPCRLNGTADRLFATALSLPSGSSLTDEEQDRVISSVLQALK